ncbi:MAG: hypothetical protein JNL21_36755 [Myxococcales bacterium]|nr:hypothetical protein [Myxococcales bacterium]
MSAPPSSREAPAPAESPTASVSPSTPAAPAASATAAPAAPSITVPFEAAIADVPVHSIAFGEKRMAALAGGVAWIEEGAGWEKMPALPADTSASRVFFGRDDRPRIMGSAGGEYVYLRFKNGAWKRGDEEIANLASKPRAPLYGVLGHADPEVVCKLGGGCILKRRSGWTLFEPPALADPPRVELCGAEPWGFGGREVWKITNGGFVPLKATPTFERADGLWAVTENDVWVVERGADAIHHFDGARWSRAPSAIDGPRSVWASSAKDVWVVGDGGAALFDGASWRRVEGAPSRALTVFGRSAGDVWIGAERGLFRRASGAAR